MNSLPFFAGSPLIHYFFANISLSNTIIYLSLTSEFTLNSLSVIRFISFSVLHYWSYIFSQIFYEFAFTYANSLLIHHRFHETSMDTSSLRIYYDFTICFVNSLSIHYFIADIDYAFYSQVWLFNVHLWLFWPQIRPESDVIRIEI